VNLTSTTLVQDFRRRIAPRNQEQVLAASKQMQETEMSFNLQYL